MSNNMTAGRIDPNWHGPNIFAMVLGFVFFWPLGLVFLYMIMTGRDVPEQLRAGWQWLRIKVQGQRFTSPAAWTGARSFSGNRAFDDHLRAEYARLDEERQRLEEEKQAFAAFLDRIGQDRDREIFEEWRSARVGRDTHTAL